MSAADECAIESHSVQLCTCLSVTSDRMHHRLIFASDGQDHSDCQIDECDYEAQDIVTQIWTRTWRLAQVQHRLLAQERVFERELLAQTNGSQPLDALVASCISIIQARQPSSTQSNRSRFAAAQRNQKIDVDDEESSSLSSSSDSETTSRKRKAAEQIAPHPRRGRRIR